MKLFPARLRTSRTELRINRHSVPTLHFPSFDGSEKNANTFFIRVGALVVTCIEPEELNSKKGRKSNG